MIELVGLEGSLVGLPGARDAAALAGLLLEPRNGSSIDRNDGEQADSRGDGLFFGGRGEKRRSSARTRR